MAHAIVMTELMQGTYDPTALVSVRYMGTGSTETDIDNGNVVLAQELISDEREIFKGVTPAVNSDIKDIVLLAAPEVMADERKKNMNEFYNEAGTNIRGYRLISGRMFSATAEAFDGTPTVGKIVELKAGTMLKVVASATSGSTVVGKIMEVEELGADTYYVVKIA